MSINKFNSEGYHDPTAYEAMTNIVQKEKRSLYKPLVYICSPFAASQDGTQDIEYNISKAREYSRYAVSMNTIPIAPHLLFPQFMDDDDKKQRALAIFMGLVIMKKCQEVWCFGDRISAGMAIELEKAKKRGTKIRYFTDKCEEIKKICIRHSISR